MYDDGVKTRYELEEVETREALDLKNMR